MTMRPMTRGMLVLVAAAVLAVAAGCDLTNSERRKAETATTSEMDSIRQDVGRLQDEVHAINRDLTAMNDTLRDEIAALRNAVNQIDGKSADRVTAAKQELAAEINKIEERRVADKNALNKKMDWIAAQLAKVAGTASGSSGDGSAGATRTEQGFEYVVKEGDTVWKIAATLRDKAGASVDDILKANGLNANSVIRPGDTLFIPIKQ
jgi:septal ring factor EnvC (AmiA/AmiB activator)